MWRAYSIATPHDLATSRKKEAPRGRSETGMKRKLAKKARQRTLGTEPEPSQIGKMHLMIFRGGSSSSR